MSENYTPRLKARYRADIRTKLGEEFGYDNVMQIPGVTKVVVNMGVGEAARDSKLINGALEDLTLITGQKPELRRAKKSIANFKLREGMPIGARVTLRGDRMWEFLDRLLTVALPRIRDFRGLSDQQFDGHGNYTFGLTEQTMFYEIDVDKIDRPRGMDITVVTTATNDDEGRALSLSLSTLIGSESAIILPEQNTTPLAGVFWHSGGRLGGVVYTGPQPHCQLGRLS